MVAVPYGFIVLGLQTNNFYNSSADKNPHTIAEGQLHAKEQRTQREVFAGLPQIAIIIFLLLTSCVRFKTKGPARKKT